MIVDDVLALLKPQYARVSMSQWDGFWGVYFSDGGTQLVGAVEPTLDVALDACLDQARAKARPPRRDFADLIG